MNYIACAYKFAGGNRGFTYVQALFYPPPSSLPVSSFLLPTFWPLDLFVLFLLHQQRNAALNAAAPLQFADVVPLPPSLFGVLFPAVITHKQDFTRLSIKQVTSTSSRAI